MPDALPFILQGILAAVQAAPQVESVVTSAKNLITSLVEAKLITAEQQNALHAWVDSHVALAKLGIAPNVAWTVEPDPT